MRDPQSPMFASRWVVLRLAALLVVSACGSDPAGPVEPRPPLGPTIFIDPDIITSTDPTALVSVVDAGTGDRLMFDRREDDFVTYEAYLFDASFDDGMTVEVQVNPEFEAVDALAAAEEYAAAVGRLPAFLRTDVETVWIHRGSEDFGGGNANLLIHTGRADEYDFEGVLEEALIHEAAHTTLDATHARASGWLAAQEADGNHISQYAADNAGTEDLAESLVPFIAVQYRSDRITDFLEALIRKAIPARIEYLASQSFELHPFD